MTASDFAARRITLESCQNFRDLGGYQADDGRRVRWGVLFRSDTLHRLTSADIETLNELGITTVIDLRSAGEISRTGRVLATVAAQYHHLPMFDEVAQSERRPIEENRPPGQSYIEMLQGAGIAIAEAVRAIVAAGGRPSVIHCTAGKDRTGILAGLVLSAIGVSDHDVVADYVLTNECRAERDAFLEVHDPEYLAMLRTLPPWVREASAATMQATLDHVRARWGSAAGYLESLGVAPLELSSLRESLLEG
jgi:protein tyrosine/serine phosphatase